ncbi:MAG: sulfurtransferase TusA family protein [Sulfurospirillaceae bacterium]|nr:sulfurtransferase TusA family protein [Sulfurospirillaceae bacterium]
MSKYEIPKLVHDDLEIFKKNHADFLAGTLDSLTFKTMRVPFGVYEQREPNTYMVRIKLAGGAINPEQLLGLADLAEQYAHKNIHITTRAGAQLHYVKIEDIVVIMEKLHTLGLSGRGGGGNTVRNISSDPLGGTAKDELFDVSPYSLVLTSKMLDQKDSFALPRKFKITFSGSSADRGYATIHDVGFIAKIVEGKRGFSLFVAGGMGAKSRIGTKIADFIPENEIFLYSQAIKQVFDKNGNRKNKHAARLRFLFDELGEAQFLTLLQAELEAVKKEGNWEISIPETPTERKVTLDKDFVIEEKYQTWWNRFVYAQKQEGLYGCKVPMYLGDISYEDARVLANALAPFGEDVLRFSADQNLYLRNLTAGEMVQVHDVIQNISVDSKRPTVIGDMVACTGAATCQLGITRPRGAVEAIQKRLAKVVANFDAIQGFKIHFSGCPNSCGKHQIADLGFFGKVQRNEGYSYPAYNIIAGSRIHEDGSSFAQKCGDVAAFHVPAFVEEVLHTWVLHVKNFNAFADWVDADGRGIIEEITKKYNTVPSFKDDKNPYFDYSCDDIFSLKGKGSGECSAGMYDLIEADKKALKIALEAEVKDFENIRLLSARMLLVTRGEDARDKEGVLKAFKKHFVDTTLLNASFGLPLEGDADERSIELAHEVIKLYESMDNTLKFAKEKELKVVESKTEEAVRFKDYSGVACPMNFVKTKMDLAQMKSGEVLEIILDDGAPIDNVPKSVQGEGHTIASTTKEGNGWRVRIIKK